MCEPKVLVGIPAYNEERTIGDVVSRSLPHATEVVVVDDGSTDLTAFRVLDSGATLIRFTHNQGKGVAVAALLEHARRHGADVLVLIDGDGQHDPDEIPSLISPCLAGEADVIVGSRYLSIRSRVPVERSLGQRAFNLMTAVASGVRCSDSQSGFRAFSRRAICSMRISEASFSVESEQQFECRLRGLRLAEVPISCSYEVPEKRSPYLHGLLVLRRPGVMAWRRRLLSEDPVVSTGRAVAVVDRPFPVRQPLESPEPLALLVGD